MTRTNIFLGITTASLAIAGVAAAKRHGIVFTRFYVTTFATACHALPSDCIQNTGTFTCKGIYTDGSPNQNQFTGPLFTQGGSNTVVVPASKCKTKVVWDGVH